MKVTIKTKCDTVSSNTNQSVVRLAVEGQPIPTGKDQPPARIAKTLIQCIFTDSKSGANFEPGKEYTVTIEGGK